MVFALRPWKVESSSATICLGCQGISQKVLCLFVSRVRLMVFLSPDDGIHICRGLHGCGLALLTPLWGHALRALPLFSIRQSETGLIYFINPTPGHLKWQGAMGHRYLYYDLKLRKLLFLVFWVRTPCKSRFCKTARNDPAKDIIIIDRVAREKLKHWVDSQSYQITFLLPCIRLKFQFR